MFGKVNVLLLAVFGAILGVQLFWSWGQTPGGVSGTAERGAALVVDAPRDYAALAQSSPVATTQGEVLGGAGLDAVVSAPLPEAPLPGSLLESEGISVDAAPTGEGSLGDFSTSIDSAAIEANGDLDIEASLAPSSEEERNVAEKSKPVVVRSGLAMTSAETLSVRFHGYGEISGVYRVNDDETISVPVIGRVSVTDLTASELEAELGDKVFEVTGRRSDVTVEVDRYLPIFVSGVAKAPGSFLWQRNMTVMHAVALAGGLYRDPDRLETNVGIIDTKLEVEQTLAELKRLLLRAARLQAERDNTDEIATPTRLVSLVGEEEAIGLIENEQALLLAARSAAALEREAVEASLRAARDEIVRLKEFEAALKAKLDERNAHIERMADLETRGFVSEERMSELRMTVIELETNLATVRVSISRAEAARLELERQRISLVQTRAAKISEELTDLRVKISQAQLAYDAARARLMEMGASKAETDVQTSKVTYEILRRDGDAAVVATSAHAYDKLLPGDILVIAIERGEEEAAPGEAGKFSSVAGGIR